MMTVGELLAYLRLDDDPFRRALTRARDRFREWGARTAQDSDRYGRDAGRIYGRGFYFASDGTLRNSRGHFVSLEQAARLAAERAGRSFGRRLLDFIGDGLRSVFSMFSGAAGNAGTAVTNLTTNIWNWIPAILSAIAALAAAGPAVYVFAGALGSLPALLAGAGALFGVFALGMKGVTDAFKKHAGGGGAVVDTAHRVAQAQKAVARAHKDVRASTEAVNKARRDEIKHLRDLNLQLQRSALSEESAAAAVAEARAELARARGLGDANEIAAADRNLREAMLSLEEAKNAHADLAEEKAESDRLGVEGSERVQQALDRQAAAVDALADAQYSLAEAQKKSGAGGAASELVKLAPAAQDFVNKIKKLGPAFDGLRLHVQERLFRGLGDTVVKLAGAWLPTLHTQMGKLADVTNGFLKDLAGSLSKKSFIDNMTKGLDGFRGMVERIGKAVSGPLVDAFGRLAGASGPFLEQLGDSIAHWIERFSSWIERLDKNGTLKSFFEEAGQAVTDLFGIIGELTRTFSILMGILFQTQPKSGGKTDSPMGQLHTALIALNAWLSDPENQQKIKDFLQGFKDGLIWMVEEGIPKAVEFIETMKKWVEKIDGWIETADRWKTKITTMFDKAEERYNTFKAVVTSPLATLGAIWDPLWTGFRTNLNKIIAAWNRLEFNLPTGSFMGVDFGGGKIATPDIHELAAGAMVGHRPGGTIARIGEGREDEMVAPVSRAQAMIRQAVADVLAGLDLGGGDVIVHVDGEVIERRALRAVRRNPDAVAAAAKAGDRSRTFVGGRRTAPA